MRLKFETDFGSGHIGALIESKDPKIKLVPSKSRTTPYIDCKMSYDGTTVGVDCGESGTGETRLDARCNQVRETKEANSFRGTVSFPQPCFTENIVYVLARYRHTGGRDYYEKFYVVPLPIYIQIAEQACANRPAGDWPGLRWDFDLDSDPRVFKTTPPSGRTWKEFHKNATKEEREELDRRVTEELADKLIDFMKKKEGVL